MKSASTLYIIIVKSVTIYKLPTLKDQSLLIWRDTIRVLDLRFDIVNRIRRIVIYFKGLSGESLYIDDISFAYSFFKSYPDELGLSCLLLNNLFMGNQCSVLL